MITPCSILAAAKEPGSKDKKLLGGNAFAISIKSPDGLVALSFDIKDIDGIKNCAVYNVSYKGKAIIKNSRLGFELDTGSTLDRNFQLRSTATESCDNTWKPVYGERNTIRDQYNQVSVILAHTQSPPLTLKLELRCYDAGAALRYTIKKSNLVHDITIKKENTEFRFLGDHTVWVTNYP